MKVEPGEVRAVKYPRARTHGLDSACLSDGLRMGLEVGSCNSRYCRKVEQRPSFNIDRSTGETERFSKSRAIYFRSVPGRYYGVQRTTNLNLTESWVLESTRVASATQTRLVLPAGGSQIFYRVLALP